MTIHLPSDMSLSDRCELLGIDTLNMAEQPSKTPSFPDTLFGCPVVLTDSLPHYEYRLISFREAAELKTKRSREI